MTLNEEIKKFAEEYPENLYLLSKSDDTFFAQDVARFIRSDLWNDDNDGPYRELCEALETEDPQIIKDLRGEVTTPDDDQFLKWVQSGYITMDFLAERIDWERDKAAVDIVLGLAALEELRIRYMSLAEKIARDEEMQELKENAPEFDEFVTVGPKNADVPELAGYEIILAKRKADYSTASVAEFIYGNSGGWRLPTGKEGKAILKHNLLADANEFWVHECAFPYEKEQYIAVKYQSGDVSLRSIHKESLEHVVFIRKWFK